LEDIGFKKLDLDNWKKPDEMTTAFRRLSDGEPKIIQGNDWMRKILKPKLIGQVPIEVKRLFEVVRGAFAYGYYFYPLYTLGTKQLYRVSESAIKHKCRLCSVPKKAKSFCEKLNWLKGQEIISESEHTKWTATRKLRNITSHPDNQSILMPSMAITHLSLSSEMINKLFEDI